MKNVLLILFLLTIESCSDYRKPTSAQRKCFVKRLGEENTKKLFDSLRKYHRSHGKATLLDYILDKRPDLKSIADECLLSIKRRRLDRRSKKKNIDKDELDKTVKYYVSSLLKDGEAKDELFNNLKKNKNLAILSCKSFLEKKEYCRPVVESLLDGMDKKEI